MVWVHGLRGEKPKNLEAIGLKEFYLNNNRLGNNFIRAIAKVLKYDEYLRVLDLRNNRITETSIR